MGRREIPTCNKQSPSLLIDIDELTFLIRNTHGFDQPWTDERVISTSMIDTSDFYRFVFMFNDMKTIL